MAETSKWRIAVDGMGGDQAPAEIVAGAVEAAHHFPDVEIQLYGDESALRDHMPADLPTNLAVVHAPEKITSEDEPVKAIRQKKGSSMVMAARAIKSGQADAMLSAGNSGALLSSGLLIVGRMKGIERPAFMAALPNLSQPGDNWLLIDSGANSESKAKHLVQYAQMGQAYAEQVQGKSSARVALLNNGAEASKGTEVLKVAHQSLSQSQVINFTGNIEARDVLPGQADVVVADGFTGNAVLKSIEGTASQVMKVVTDALKNGNLSTKLGGLLIKKQLKDTLKSMDYNQVGGALLFGVKAPVIKCHGTANAKNIFYAIQQAIQVLDAEVVPELANRFADDFKREKAAQSEQDKGE